MGFDAVFELVVDGPDGQVVLDLLEGLLEEAASMAAWGEFVRIYGPAVMGWCRKRGLQHGDAPTHAVPRAA